MVDEKISALNKKHVETALQAAQIVFDSIEKLARLNIAAVKMLFQEGIASAKALASTTDVEQLNEWRDGQARAGADKVLGYSRNVYEIAFKAQADIGELLEQSLLESGQEARDWVEVALKSSPVGQSEATASAAKAAMVNAQAMIEGISKAAKQAAGYADANVRAAATATAEAVKSAAKQRMQGSSPFI
ncbi:MAG TPA: phasin family protein [Burkholderiales bacterium]|jgi:phasin family protein|nr:phasin family protein [Burkholderiales bacterium]